MITDHAKGISPVNRRTVLVVNYFFVFLEVFCCFVIAIYDLVQDVEAVFHLP